MSTPRSSAAALTRRRFLGLGVGLGGGLALGALSAYSFVIDRLAFRVEHFRVAITDLPRSLDGLRILQLTDLHHGPWMGRGLVEAVLAKAAAIPCDLVALTGDYVHGDESSAKLEWVIPALARLGAPLGVHAVLGNHDHYAGADRARALLAEHGISRVHSRVAIERDDGRLWLAGTGDLWEDHVDVDRLLRGVPADEPRIVLAHNPDSADAEWNARVDLMLSGHTHGGQVLLPFVGAPYLPIANPRYLSGLVATPRTQLFVSRGLGSTSAPVRFRCPPQLAVLELTRREPANPPHAPLA